MCVCGGVIMDGGGAERVKSFCEWENHQEKLIG